MTSIFCIPKPAVSILDGTWRQISLNENKPPPQIRIKRGLEIILYRKKVSFHIPNTCTVFNFIFFQNLLHQLTTSQDFPCLEENIQLFYCHVARNLASCVSTKLTYQFITVYMFVVFKWSNGEMVKF